MTPWKVAVLFFFLNILKKNILRGEKQNYGFEEMPPGWALLLCTTCCSEGSLPPKNTTDL